MFLLLLLPRLFLIPSVFLLIGLVQIGLFEISFNPNSRFADDDDDDSGTKNSSVENVATDDVLGTSRDVWKQLPTIAKQMKMVRNLG